MFLAWEKKMEIMEKRSSGEKIPLSLRKKKLSVKERRQNTECGWRADDGHLLACQSVPRVHPISSSPGCRSLIWAWRKFGWKYGTGECPKRLNRFWNGGGCVRKKEGEASEHRSKQSDKSSQSEVLRPRLLKLPFGFL